jgi:hypothetical protein
LIAASFPTHKEFPAKKFMEKIMQDKIYLNALTIKTLSYLAETPFRKLLSPNIIQLVLEVHPKLILFLKAKGKAMIPRLIHEPFFLERMQCRVIQYMVADLKFVNRLSRRDMKRIFRSPRVWECLRVEEIRRLLKKVHLAGKIEFRDILCATRLISKSKMLDMRVVWNMFRYQFPYIAKNGLMNLFYHN